MNKCNACEQMNQYLMDKRLNACIDCMREDIQQQLLDDCNWSISAVAPYMLYPINQHSVSHNFFATHVKCPATMSHDCLLTTGL